MRLFAMMLLAMMSGGAAADWTLVERQGDGNNLYADSATIRRNGDIASIWVVHDGKTPVVDRESGKKALSTRSQYEFDCKNMKLRILSTSNYSGNMGKGSVTYSAKPDARDEWGKWNAVVFESEDGALWKFACVKR